MTGPSKPLALMSVTGTGAGTASSEIVTESERVIPVPSSQTTVKVVFPPTAGYQGSPGAISILADVETPDKAGEVSSQETAPTLETETLKEVEASARVRLSAPSAVIFTLKSAAKATNAKKKAKKRPPVLKNKTTLFLNLNMYFKNYLLLEICQGKCLISPIVNYPLFATYSNVLSFIKNLLIFYVLFVSIFLKNLII